MTRAELLTIRAQQLEKREEDLAAIADRVYAARKQLIAQFIKAHKNRIVDYDFKPGALVLVRNSAVEMELDRKSKPRYLGPMLVVRRTRGGAYILAELDGATSKLRYAAFRLVPYYPRTQATAPIASIVHTDPEETEEDKQASDDEGEPEELTGSDS